MFLELYDAYDAPLPAVSCRATFTACCRLSDFFFFLGKETRGKIRKMIKLPYLKSQVRSQMKMVRKLEDGGYIISASGENKVYILNAKGAVKRTIDLNTLEKIKANEKAIYR